MPSPDAHVLDNAAWWALATHHAELAEVQGRARRYPADVSVFAGVDHLDEGAWADLAGLVRAGAPAAIFRAEVPDPPAGWTVHARGQARQMTSAAPDLVAPPAPAPVLRRLTIDDAGPMLALVEETQPGPFEVRTVEMGRYWGHHDADGRLVAMAGERLHLEGWTEISAVCTHPDVRGRGLATALTHHVAAAVLERGERPFLHVAEQNHGARRVYERLGFVERRPVEFAVLEAPAA
jgi:ribosomal protein S18 acetylase RimI-like enzyme